MTKGFTLNSEKECHAYAWQMLLKALDKSKAYICNS